MRHYVPFPPSEFCTNIQGRSVSRIIAIEGTEQKNMAEALPFLVFIAISATIFYFYRRRRVAQQAHLFAALEQKLQWTPFTHEPAALKNNLKHFHLFSRSTPVRIRHVLTHTAGPAQLKVFELQHGSMLDNHSYRYFVLLATNPLMNLPQFGIHPANLRFSVSGATKPAHFTAYPNLSRHYVISTDNLNVTMQTLQQTVLAAFDRLVYPPRTPELEGDRNQLLFYRLQVPGDTLDTLNQFVQQGIELYQIVATASSKQHTEVHTNPPCVFR